MKIIGIDNVYFSSILVLFFLCIIIITARDVDTLDSNILYIKLIFRIIFNKDVTNKFVVSLDVLKQVVPIESVEDSGLITYPDGSSSVLISYIPPRDTEYELEQHTEMVLEIIKSLYGGFSFQFISNTVVDYSNPLLDSTSDSMKQVDLSKSDLRHLHSLHEEANEQKQSVIVEFTLVVYFPVTKTVSEAEQLRESLVPSLLKSLDRADILAWVIEDRNKVILNLMEQAC